MEGWSGKESVGREEVGDVAVGAGVVAVAVAVAVGGYVRGHDHVEEVSGRVGEGMEGKGVSKVNPFGPSLVLYLCLAAQHTQLEGEEERRSTVHDTYYSALYILLVYRTPFLVKKGVYSSSNSEEGSSLKEYWEELRMEEGWTVEGCYNLGEEAYTSGKMHGQELSFSPYPYPNLFPYPCPYRVPAGHVEDL